MLPLAAGLLFSLSNAFGLTGTFSHGFTLDHVEKLFTSSEFISAICYSFYIAIVVIVISTGVALMISIHLCDQKTRRGFEKQMHLPLVFPTAVVAFIMYHILSGTGLLSRIGKQLGLYEEIREFPVMINDVPGIGIIIVHTLLAIPFLTILFINLYRQHSLTELKLITYELGANNSFFRQKVALPILLKAARPTLILYTIFVLGVYETPLLLGNEKWQMISMLVVTKLRRFDLMDLPYAYAIAGFFAILTIVLGPLMLRKNQQL